MRPVAVVEHPGPSSMNAIDVTVFFRWLSVKVLEEAGDQVLILLPRHTFENGMAITVRTEDVRWKNVPQLA